MHLLVCILVTVFWLLYFGCCVSVASQITMSSMTQYINIYKIFATRRLSPKKVCSLPPALNSDHGSVGQSQNFIGKFFSTILENFENLVELAQFSKMVSKKNFWWNFVTGQVGFQSSCLTISCKFYAILCNTNFLIWKDQINPRDLQ